ncbi:MAG: class I SAM-dependent methyltransferase [Desulfamplus sp.]|nr:class I SAM-dependent methyltransferase [Desulfamplus sp.]
MDRMRLRFYETILGKPLLRGTNFECPICAYKGPFVSVNPLTGRRANAICPNCRSAERQRLQYLVLSDLDRSLHFGNKRVLHFAPEKVLGDWFRGKAASYESADLLSAGVNHQVDITALPFSDESYDVVFASHVLEHIHEDNLAIRELRRVLSPGGIAILPVPIVTLRTVEYSEANPNEAGYVRAAGIDYFARYRLHFREVRIVTSSDFPERYQTYTYEDRNNPNKVLFPGREPIPGERHIDYVPICFK